VLELYNTQKMKKSKFTLTLFTFSSLILGVVVFYLLTNRINPVEIGIVGLIVLLGLVQLYNSYKDKIKLDNGLTIDDELSQSVKYKSGYITFKNSFYVWLIFLYFELFGFDLEVYQIVGGGVILNTFLFLIIKKVQESRMNEK